MWAINWTGGNVPRDTVWDDDVCELGGALVTNERVVDTTEEEGREADDEPDCAEGRGG